MAETDSERAPRTTDLRVAFERICNLVAIVEARRPFETLQLLIEQCLVVLPNQAFRTASDLNEALESLFGIISSEEQVDEAIAFLLAEGRLRQLTLGTLALDAARRNALEAEVQSAQSLERRVRLEWEAEVLHVTKSCDSQELWLAFREFLALAFRRHGLQTARLLDPAYAPGGVDQPLTTLLREAVDAKLPPACRPAAEAAISTFLAGVGHSADRSAFVSQLADGAFAFFSLQLDPIAAEEFLRHLDAANVFLDTNFLFAALRLNSGPAVAVANELVSLVTSSSLPFRLYYHSRTSRELRATVTYYGDMLRERTWSQQFSKAIVDSRSTTGLIARYHELNAAQPTTVKDFLRPLSEIDQVLKSRNVILYPRSNHLPQSRLDSLTNRYRDFLTSLGREKSDSVIEHDMTVLATVIDLQEQRPSDQIGARAILLSFDYNLYRFEEMLSLEEFRQPVVVLPSTFMQVLRPLIKHRPDFDRAFAETFALPEFRTVGSGSVEIMFRVISLLASFKDIRPDLAYRILTNTTLRDNLRTSKSDEQIAKQVENTIIDDNNRLASLLTEHERKLFDANASKAAANEALDALRRAKRQEAERKDQRIDELLSENRRLQDAIEKSLQPQPEPTASASVGPTVLIGSIERASDLQVPNAPLSPPQDRNDLLPSWGAWIISLLLATVLVLAALVLDISWLENHPRRVGVFGLAWLAVVVGVSGLLQKRFLTGGLGAIVPAIVIALLTVIDGQ